MRILQKNLPDGGCWNTAEGNSTVGEYQLSEICKQLMHGFWDVGSPPHYKKAKIYKKIFEGKILDVLANFSTFVGSDTDGSNFKNFYKLSIVINDETLCLELIYEGAIGINPHESWGVDIGLLEDIVRKEDEDSRYGFPKILSRMRLA